MAMLCIKCVKTGKLIATGLDVDRESFATMTISNNSVKCSECGMSHSWSKEDAVFSDPKTGPLYERN